MGFHYIFSLVGISFRIVSRQRHSQIHQSRQTITLLGIFGARLLSPRRDDTLYFSHYVCVGVYSLMLWCGMPLSRLMFEGRVRVCVYEQSKNLLKLQADG